jgi:cytochrome c6
MKNQLSKIKTFVVLASIAIALFFQFTVNSNRSLASSASDSLATTDGAAIYQQSCSRCHGADGKAQTPKGKQTRATDLTKSTISDAKGIKVISNGKELMPGFKGTLSADDMQNVMNYIRGFRP